MKKGEQEVLLARIKELEEKIAQLRVNRRVLLSLLEKVERDKRHRIHQLEKQNKVLQLKNARLARSALAKQGHLTLVEGQGKEKP